MVRDENAGIFFSLDECKVLYVCLKRNESFLSREERKLLLRTEKVLYVNLSVKEIEELV